MVESSGVKQGPHPLGGGLHHEEHSSDIRMVDNGDTGRVRILRCRDFHTLYPLLTVLKGIEIGGRRYGQALYPHGDSLLVHHLEHVLDSLTLLPDDVPDAVLVLTEIEHAGWRCVHAHFLLDASYLDIIQVSHRAIRIHAILGNEEKADPFDSRGCSFCAGKNEMDDVVRQVVVPARDETLRSNDLVVVSLLLSLALGVSHVASCLRLGHAHRACPLPRIHLLQVGLLHLFVSEALNQVRCISCETGCSVRAVACADEELLHRHHDRSR